MSFERFSKDFLTNLIDSIRDGQRRPNSHKTPKKVKFETYVFEPGFSVLG